VPAYLSRRDTKVNFYTLVLAQNIFTKKGIFLVSTIKVFSRSFASRRWRTRAHSLLVCASQRPGMALSAAAGHRKDAPWPFRAVLYWSIFEWRTQSGILSLEARTRPSAFSVSCARDGGRRCVKNVKGAIKWLILTVDKLINGIPLEWLGRRSCGYAIAARRVYNSHDSKNSPEMCCCAPYLRPPRTSARKKKTDITPLPKERGN
jgi:hypothetical protein